MRTLVISEDALGLPWIEHFPVKGGPPEKTIIDKSPFIVGRGESADLQIVSEGVSREHVALVHEGLVTRIRDLGSTNGTFVNGQRIKEVELHDGDMVQVANVELAFYGGKSQARQAAVTSVLGLDADDAQSDADCGDPAGDLLRVVRRLHERLVSGCVQGRLKSIVDLQQMQVAGYESSDGSVSPAGPDNQFLLPPIPGRVAARLRHLARVRSVEQVGAMPGELPVFVPVQAAEVASGRFLELAGMLCELLEDPRRLVMAVPCAAASEAAEALRPGGTLRELGPSVALFGLGARDADLALLDEIGPDFVRLPAALLHEKRPAKSIHSIPAIIRAAHTSGAKVIAAGIRTPADRVACLEVGCELGQGTLFDQRKRADASSRKDSRGGPLTARDAFYLSVASDPIELS